MLIINWKKLIKAERILEFTINTSFGDGLEKTEELLVR